MPEYLTRVTSKGQVTIPKAVRDRYGIEEGDYLVFDPQDDQLVVRKGTMVATSPADDRDFEALADRIADQFEERGITRADVEEVIRWARKK